MNTAIGNHDAGIERTDYTVYGGIGDASVIDQTDADVHDFAGIEGAVVVAGSTVGGVVQNCDGSKMKVCL